MGVASNMREHHKDQLIEVLMHYCPQDVRRLLMDECPAAYNDYCGREVVQVFIVSDFGADLPNVPITPAATYTERYRAALLAKQEV